MGEAFGTHGENRNAHGDLMGKLGGRHHLESQCLDGRIVVK
jgi:hypothetical protein